MAAASERGAAPGRTRGEKCILAHVAVTAACVACVLAVCAVHAGLVRHERPAAHPLTRRAGGERALAPCAGSVWAGARAACSCVPLGARWSLAPARCVAARAHPRLAHLLPHWSVRYTHGGSAVTRALTHPHYEPERQTSAAGLLHHAAALPPPAARALRCELPTEPVVDDELHKTEDIIIQWRNGTNEPAWCRCVVLSARRCARVVRSVMLRDGAHEACVVPAPACALHSPTLGAAVFVRGRLAGLVTWGEVRAARGDVGAARGDVGAARGDVGAARGDVGAARGDVRAARGDTFPLVTLLLHPHAAWIRAAMAL